MPLYAPTASVASYQLLPLTVSPLDTIDDILHAIDYSYQRTQIWTTKFQRYNDQGIETMPKQVIKQNAWEIKIQRWVPDDIAPLETFIDDHYGTGLPFYFTSPDDGVANIVYFAEDKISFTVPGAAVRTATIKLVEAGDTDNSLNNDLVYPSYVEPPLIVLAAPVTGSASPQTIHLNTSARLAAGQSIIVGDGTPASEISSVISVVSGNQISAIVLNNHVTNEVVELA